MATRESGSSSYIARKALRAAQGAQFVADSAIDLAVQSFEGATLVNGTLGTSVTGGALTITILTASGSIPSPTDLVPVQVTFRDNTAVERVIQVTGPKSITIPSGGEVGVISFKATRIWVVGLLNDAKTDFELAVINRLTYTSGTQIRVYTLPDRYWYGNELGFATIGTGSDSSGVLYTNNISSAGRGIRILGQLMYESGMTAGTWVNPTNIVLQGRGVLGPGAVVNQGLITRNTKSSVTISVALPSDNTRPANAGPEFGFYDTIQITPQSGSNLFDVEFDGYVSAPTGATTGDYLAVGVGISNSDWSLLGFNQCNGSDAPTLMRMGCTIVPPIGGLNQNNMQFGVACTKTGTAAVNGTSGGSLFGGAGTVQIKITEIIA